jgi:Xaa-Pro aminopeptidase
MNLEIQQIYTDRRNILIKNIQQKYPNKKGTILLFSAFENKYKFRQDSTFYYLTNLEEPGIALSIELLDNAKKQVIYIPKYKESRAKWSESILSSNPTQKYLKTLNIDNIEYLGDFVNGYNISPVFNKAQYENLINFLKQNKDYTIFTTFSQEYTEQYLLIKQILNIMPELEKNIVDISDIIAQMRCKKSLLEAENIYNAVGCTMAAHDMAARIISSEKFEFEVQAGAEFIFQQSGGRAAFPSIK